MKEYNWKALRVVNPKSGISKANNSCTMRNQRNHFGPEIKGIKNSEGIDIFAG
jgi:hypothetical protein